MKISIPMKKIMEEDNIMKKQRIRMEFITIIIIVCAIMKKT